MPDRNKVIKGLETCIKYIDQACPIGCPYHEICTQYGGRVVFQPVLRDAFELLKEQDEQIRIKTENFNRLVAKIGVMPKIVLCKDCKAWKQYDDLNLGECELFPEYNKMGDWFCNFGERKEGR